MAKSDELINAAQEKKLQAQAAEEQEAQNVKATLIALISENLDAWLDGFAAELETDEVNPGRFEYHPDQLADINAWVELNVSWRGIAGAFIAAARKNKTGVRSNGIGVRLEFHFPQRTFVGKTEYERKFSLDFPCNMPAYAEEGWLYPIFGGPVADDDLAAFLVDVLQHQNRIDTLIELEQELTEKSENRRLRNDHEHAIAIGETEIDVQQAVDAALNDFPDEAEHWNALHGQAVVAIRKKEAAQLQYVQDRDLIVDWIQDYMRCLRHNRKLLANIQADYLHEFEVGKLTFGVMVTDDDGERMVEEDHVYIDMELAGVNPVVSHWIWCWTAERPQRRICIVNPIKIEMISACIESTDKGLVRSVWVKEALETLRTPVIVDPVTFQAELDMAEFLEFPKCELGDIRKHTMHVKAFEDAIKHVFSDGIEYKVVNELQGAYYRAAQTLDDHQQEDGNEFPF